MLEYCGGGDLSTLLSKGEALPPGFTLMAASGVAAGMAHLHGCGVLHRDLKGANVLLDDAGGIKLTYISPISPLCLDCISPISPLHRWDQAHRLRHRGQGAGRHAARYHAHR